MVTIRYGHELTQWVYRGYRRHKYVFKRDLGDIKMTDSKIANDPAPVPHAEPMHGSYHWSFERYASVLSPYLVAERYFGSRAIGSRAINTDTVATKID